MPAGCAPTYNGRPDGNPSNGGTHVEPIVIRRFDNADETRKFEKGIFELVNVGGMALGRATYDPGWKWSEHVAPIAGTKNCQVEHVGMVVAGSVTVAMDDGSEFELAPGDLFYVPPGHDSWVLGDEPYVSIHLLGAADYAH